MSCSLIPMSSNGRLSHIKIVTIFTVRRTQCERTSQLSHTEEIQPNFGPTLAAMQLNDVKTQRQRKAIENQ